MDSQGAHPSDVYARELFKRKFGWPLWHPELRHRSGGKKEPAEVQVGDVGLIVEGSFISLFNAIAPRADQGPPGHIPLAIPEDGLFTNEYYLQPDIITSSSMTALGIGARLDVHSVSASFDFECFDNQAAFLVFKDYARCAMLQGFDRRIKKYVGDHYKSWLRYQGSLGFDEDETRLAFIAGWIKTSEWALGSIQQKGKSGKLQFNANFATATAQLSVKADSSSWLTLDQRMGPPLAHRTSTARNAAKDHKQDQPGPGSQAAARSSKKKNKGKKKQDASSYSEDQELGTAVTEAEEPQEGSGLPKNQCVFINYFKVKTRLSLFPEVIKAAAGPHHLPKHEDPESVEAMRARSDALLDDEVVVERVPRIQLTYDPVGSVLDYILQNSEAEVAIACDWHLVQVCCDNIPDDIPGYLQEAQPPIEVTEEGIGTLLLDDYKHHATRIGLSEEAIVVRPMGESEASHEHRGREASKDRRGDRSLDRAESGDLPLSIIDQQSDSKVPGTESRKGQKADQDGVMRNIERGESGHIPLSVSDETGFDDAYVLHPVAGGSVGPHGLDIDDTRSDMSSEITEIPQEDFPSYFQERNNRIFHAHGHSPYPLPVDMAEQNRCDAQHLLFRKLIGEDFVGPVPEMLRQLRGERLKVLDLATGTGKWVIDMAPRFPHVLFCGLDIVPIMTRYPPDNVLFEMQDIEETMRYHEGSIALVHARTISMAVLDYRALLQEVARVLRPGGLFIAGEWGLLPYTEDGDEAVRAPHTCAFFRAVLSALQMRGGVHPTAPHIFPWLCQSGDFQDIEEVTYNVPIGAWMADPRKREVGRMFKETLKTYTQSVRGLLLDSGQHDRQKIQELADAWLLELDTVPGLCFKYYAVHARREYRENAAEKLQRTQPQPGSMQMPLQGTHTPTGGTQTLSDVMQTLPEVVQTLPEVMQTLPGVVQTLPDGEQVPPEGTHLEETQAQLEVQALTHAPVRAHVGRRAQSRRRRHSSGYSWRKSKKQRHIPPRMYPQDPQAQAQAQTQEAEMQPCTNSV